jgi:hypothetical protein
MPSFNLQRYLTARASGASVEEACATSGIGMGEAELHEADIASGELELPKINQGESDMARGNEKAKVEQVIAPDFAKMKRIFLTDLKPAEEKNAKSRGDLSAAWASIEKDCHCNKRAAKLLFRLNTESEETRDDFLRTLYGGMKALGIGISQDLVDKMSGEDAPVMPTVSGKGLGEDNLATIGAQREEDALAFDNDAKETLPAA